MKLTRQHIAYNASSIENMTAHHFFRQDHQRIKYRTVDLKQDMKMTAIHFTQYDPGGKYAEGKSTIPNNENSKKINHHAHQESFRKGFERRVSHLVDAII